MRAELDTRGQELFQREVARARIVGACRVEECPGGSEMVVLVLLVLLLACEKGRFCEGRRTKYSMCSAIELYALNSAALSLGSLGSSFFSSCCISLSASSRPSFFSRILLSDGSAGFARRSTPFVASWFMSAIVVVISCLAGKVQVRLLLSRGIFLDGVRMRILWITGKENGRI